MRATDYYRPKPGAHPEPARWLMHENARAHLFLGTRSVCGFVVRTPRHRAATAAYACATCLDLEDDYKEAAPC